MSGGFAFHVVGGSDAGRIITGTRSQIIREVRETYLAHHDGRTINPPSHFLRFPGKPNARIIALPAFVDGDRAVAGIKWIASFPDNVANNVPRASAVLLLNDYESGYPFACLEASQISAARTAASAVLAAEQLTGGRRATTIAMVGAGVIARTIVDFFFAADWAVERFAVHDRAPESAAQLERHIERLGGLATVVPTCAAAVDGADVVVFATTAGEPHVLDPGTFTRNQSVLNISLRDLGPEVVVGAHNVVDDVEHCLTANTSPHLALQKYGHQEFIAGTLAQLMRGEIVLGCDKPKIFSPFGLGVLDLAVGLHVYQAAVAGGAALDVPDFFGPATRW